jgi:putative ABC transport system permease protein
MAIGPILAQLRRKPLGAVLIALQMAITLAILANAVFIIQQRVALTQRPTGADEANIFVIRHEWPRHMDDGQARLQTDLSALRKLPGVVDAFASNTFPMSNSGWTGTVNRAGHQAHPTAAGAIYLADDHAVSTLGLKLVAGRSFLPTEVNTLNDEVPETLITSVILSRGLAEKVFPAGHAVGRSVYLDASHIATVVGVVEALATPWTTLSGGAWGTSDSGDVSNSSILWPLQPGGRYAVYIVRAQPGKLARVMAAAQEALYAIDRERIMTDVASMPEVRKDSYRIDRGFAVMLMVVCAAMLVVTACGVVGLTSYWVMQRRSQIGIRRALGGTRAAIVQHFQTENLLIAAAGTCVGAALGVALNLWAVQAVEAARMPVSYVIMGALVLLALGQLAALWPALRAASVAPALAARSA